MEKKTPNHQSEESNQEKGKLESTEIGPQAQVEPTKEARTQEQKHPKNKSLMIIIILLLITLISCIVTFFAYYIITNNYSEDTEKKDREEEKGDKDLPIVPEEQEDNGEKEDQEPAEEFQSCTATSFDGLEYQHGKSYTTLDGCQTCECNDGSWDCLINPSCIANPTQCTDPDGTHNDGDSWTTSDGCRDCTCNSGTANCNLIPNNCCVHDGLTYENGESFPNDCNTCVCTNGDVNCTLMLCP